MLLSRCFQIPQEERKPHPDSEAHYENRLVAVVTPMFFNGSEQRLGVEKIEIP